VLRRSGDGQPSFRRLECGSFQAPRGLPAEFASIIDFYVLAHADAVAISNSSYSFMASLLNERARLFVRPCLNERGLVAFDPWDAPVLLQQKLVAGEQQLLDAADAADALAELSGVALAHS